MTHNVHYSSLARIFEKDDFFSLRIFALGHPVFVWTPILLGKENEKATVKSRGLTGVTSPNFA